MLRKLVRSGVSFSGRERNCCFVNLQDGNFGNISAASGLDLPDDGRGVVTVDWDHDGDLDVWLVNRSGPQLRYMRNEQPHDSHFLSLMLIGAHSNRDAIGARVELKMVGERKSQIQTVRAGDAYLSQSSKWVHFGTGINDQIEFVKVRWPGHEQTGHEQRQRHKAEQVFQSLQIDRRYQLMQGEAQPRVPASIRTDAALAVGPSPVADGETSQISDLRILLSVPVPLPRLQFQTLDGSATKDLTRNGNQATLVNLWATWCQPCLRELADLSGRYQELQSAGISVVALSIDGVDVSHSFDTNSLADALRKSQSNFPFDVAQADGRLLDQLQIVHDNLLDRHEPLPIPSSFLLDEVGRLVAIYTGPISVDQLIRDTNSIDQSATARREMALPFAGKWSASPRSPRLLKLALDLLDRGDLGAMKEYTQRNQAELAQDSAYAVLLLNIAQQHSRRGEHVQAVALYKEALKQRPTMAPAYFNLGVTYAGTRQFDAALVCFEHADKYEPDQLDTRLALARTLKNLDRADEAVKVLAATAKIYPLDQQLQLELSIALAASGNIEAAIDTFANATKSSVDAKLRYSRRFKSAVEFGLKHVDSDRSGELRRSLDALRLE